MKSADLQTIGNTLLTIVAPDMSPKQLLKAARKAHPKASKRDVIRAASRMMIKQTERSTAE